MFVGEARNLAVAFQIAIIEAITKIREHKAKHLIGTSFISIPHDSEDTEL
jgi:hypothetical protein